MYVLFTVLYMVAILSFDFIPIKLFDLIKLYLIFCKILSKTSRDIFSTFHLCEIDDFQSILISIIGLLCAGKFIPRHETRSDSFYQVIRRVLTLSYFDLFSKDMKSGFKYTGCYVLLQVAVF